MDRTDAELLIASRDDTRAFRELYDRWADRLLAYFYRRVLDAEVAGDLLAETFAVAFERRRRFRDVGAPGAAWLYGIAKQGARALVPPPGGRAARRPPAGDRGPAARRGVDRPDRGAGRHGRLPRLAGRRSLEGSLDPREKQGAQELARRRLADARRPVTFSVGSRPAETDITGPRGDRLDEGCAIIVGIATTDDGRGIEVEIWR
jgi:Sigma-70 region 2